MTSRTEWLDRFETHAPKTGELLVIRVKENLPRAEFDAINYAAGHYKRTSGQNPTVVVLNPKTTIESLPAEEMAKLGWVRAPEPAKEVAPDASA